MGRIARCAAAALVLATAACDAAPRVDIRIVPRPRPEPDTPNLGPFPFRSPADPAGPFAGYADAVGCLVNFPGEIEGKSVLIDVCPLKNVTFIEVPTSEADAAVTETETNGGDAGDTALETSTSSSLARRQILGIFRGWKIDPIYRKFKYAVFDDGDLCGEYGAERFSVHVELIPAAHAEVIPRIFDVRKISSCSYALRVEAYVPEYELRASSSIQTPGVVDISDADEMLPQICGEMKCQYSHVAGRVDVVKQEIETLKKSLQDMVSSDSTSVAALSVSTAASIIKSSTDVMEKALELLQSIEQLEQAAQEARDAAVGATTATGSAPAATITQTADVVATS